MCSEADAEASELQSKGSGKRAFQRVVAEEWLGQKAARNNSYHSTFGNDGWGAGAQAILGQVAMLDFCYSHLHASMAMHMSHRDRTRARRCSRVESLPLMLALCHQD